MSSVPQKSAMKKTYNVLSVDVASVVREFSQKSCRTADVSALAILKAVYTDA